MQNYKCTVKALAAPDEQLHQEKHFALSECGTVDPSALAPGEVLLRLYAASVDPAFRASMRAVPLEKYMLQPYAVGACVKSFAISKVVASNADNVKVGTLVGGGFNVADWQLYSVCEEGKLPPVLSPPEGVPATCFLGAAGMPGIAALLPIRELYQKQEQEQSDGYVDFTGKTALVTGAAGAVGSLAVQLLKDLGMRVVGCAGSDEKVEFVKELGAEACWNYKTITDPAAALAELAPDGIDLFFDNVGGSILDAALKHMNKHGTILACGAISEYDGAAQPLNNWFYITINRLHVHGFIASDFFAGGAVQAAIPELAARIADGSLKAKETIVSGKFEDGVLPQAFCGLFTGANTGKMIISIEE